MANRPRTRKRVHAIRRAPDGSAFEKCGNCSVSVPIALVDMHECETKRGVKRERIENGTQTMSKLSFQHQPRSPFRFFMESFVKACNSDGNQIEVDQKGFETWWNMSKPDRLPFVLQAEKVNSAYTKALLRDVEDMSWVNDEADSAEVGRHDEKYKNSAFCWDSEDSYEFESYWSDGSESFGTDEWELLLPHVIMKP